MYLNKLDHDHPGLPNASTAVDTRVNTTSETTPERLTVNLAGRRALERTNTLQRDETGRLIILPHKP